jgi:hypothetical protein
MLACSCLHHAMKRSGAATAALQDYCRFRNNAFPGEEVASKLRPDVRLWHLADVPLVLTNVCFEGKNGHDAGVTPFPLMTQSGHRRV